MNPAFVRMIGILFLLGAVVVAVLNLHRVASLGLPWVPPMLIVFGAVLVGLSASLAKKRRS